MSYDRIRKSLNRYRESARDEQDREAERQALIDALEALTCALEYDLTQVKAALSHLAMLLEERGKH